MGLDYPASISTSPSRLGCKSPSDNKSPHDKQVTEGRCYVGEK